MAPAPHREPPAATRRPPRPGRGRRLLATASALSWRRTSIRARVTLALAGVLALIVPQVVLTVIYLVELFDHGAHVDRLAAAVQQVDGLRDEATLAFLMGFPRDGAALDRQQAALAELVAHSQELAGRLRAGDAAAAPRATSLAAHAAHLDAFASLARAHAVALEAGYRQMAAQPPPRFAVARHLWDASATLDLVTRAWRSGATEPTAAEQTSRLDWLHRWAAGLLPTLSGALVEDALGLAAAELAWRDAAALTRSGARAALARLGDLKAALATDNGAAGRAITRGVDEANRYLITLVLLTVVYLSTVVAVLPARLVRPLQHVAAVMERVGRGQLEARARVVGDDEIGALSGSLNRLLDRVATFDELKRDRIYEDRHRIAALSALIEAPVAFVDAALRIEHANAAFLALLGLSPGAPYEDRPLLDHVGGPDVASLRACLEGALEGQRTVDAVPMRLSGPKDEPPRALTLRATPGRDRHGRVAYLLVILAPSA